MDVDIRDVVAFSVLILEELWFHTLFNDPVAALACITFRSFHFVECLIQREVMTNGVVPSLLGIFSVKRESGGNPFVNLSEGQASIWCSENCHANHLRITVWWFVSIIFNHRHISRLR